MTTVSKRVKANRLKVKESQLYTLVEALTLLKSCQSAKFNETVEVVLKLGIDPKNSAQNVRGTTVLPAGSGRTIRIAVFAQGQKAVEAKEAGADIVGFDDLAEQIKAGKMDFDTLIATPDTMGQVGKLAQVLGPRGLMPNPKLGTVTLNVAQAVREAKAGKIEFRSDKGGLIHCPVGKMNFDASKLQVNIAALIDAVSKAKPASSKGVFLKAMMLSSTMGPGLKIDLSSVGAA
jgi:large subunit ribosomal protein L1